MAEEEQQQVEGDEPQWLQALRVVYTAARRASLSGDEHDVVRNATEVIEAHIRQLEAAPQPNREQRRAKGGAAKNSG